MGSHGGRRSGRAGRRIAGIGGWVFAGVWIVIIAAGAIFGNSGGSGADDSADDYAYSATDAFSFRSLDTDYTLTRADDGRADLVVRETFVADFPDYDQNKGIVRAIPETADGRSLHVDVTKVTDATGAGYPYWTESHNGFLEVFTGTDDYVHGETTYVIDYTMRDVIHRPILSSGQEFYFDVNGTGWAQPFGEVTAELHVDPALAGALTGRTSCFQGAQGSTDRCTVTKDGGGYSVDVSDLGRHENVTFSVGFAPGTFTVPVSWPRLLAWVVLAIALLVLIGCIVVRFTRLGPPKGRGVIVPQYQAYPGIGVLEAAELLDERNRAFPALVTEFVVSGAGTLTPPQTSVSDDYRLTLSDATRLDDDDAAAVHTLFGSLKPGAAVTLDHSSPKIGDRVQKLLAAAARTVRDRGLVARKSTPLSTLLLVLALAAAAAAIAAIVVLASGRLGAWPYYLALAVAIAASITGLIFVIPPERATEQAAPAYEHLLGIRDYLRLAEADRIRMLQSPEGAETKPAIDGGRILVLYEKLLPYAILFGIEDEWRTVLSDAYETTPVPGGAPSSLMLLRTAAFSSAFASSSYRTTAQVQAAHWSSSGGSSSFGGGGGFSGGGFGGGGGGGR